MSDRATYYPGYGQHSRMRRVFASSVVYTMRGKDSSGLVVTWLDRGVPRLSRPGFTEVAMLSSSALQAKK